MHQILRLQSKDNMNTYKWFVVVCHISIALSVSSDCLKSILCNHLSQQYNFFRKEICICIDNLYDGSKLFTTIPGESY